VGETQWSVKSCPVNFFEAALCGLQRAERGVPRENLPPPQDHGHVITLSSGCKLESDRLYHYAYHQKEEANRLGEMLDEGLITDSTSPFSSPIILIKKNDEPNYPITMVK